MRHLAIATAAAALIGWVGLAGLPATAAEVGLAVSPLFFSYDLAAGEQRELSLVIYNPTAEAAVVRLEALDFTVAEGGATEVGSASGASLTPWLRGPAEPFTVGPGATVVQPALLQVPADAPVGSYRGILAARTEPSVAGVSVSGRAGAYVLVNVGGPLRKSVSVGELGVSVRARTGQVSVAVTNTGNAHFLATGTVRVSGWPSGGSTLTLQPHVLLPATAVTQRGSVRALEATWPNVPWLGLWRLEATVVDGDGAAHVVGGWVSRGFGWVAALLLAVAALAVYLRRRHAR